MNEILKEDRSKAKLKQQEQVAPVKLLKLTSLDDGDIASNPLNIDAEEDLENRITTEYDHSRYFDNGYKSTLVEIVKGILAEKNGITLHELALDIANLHGLLRTSKKQLRYIVDLIKPWAGLKRDGIQKPVVWLNPDDIVDEIPWRGQAPWGDDRDWTEIPYPEAKGLARLALEKSPKDPVDYICNVFKLKRRHEKTLDQFKSWVDGIRID